jgi:hypothetical protein
LVAAAVVAAVVAAAVALAAVVEPVVVVAAAVLQPVPVLPARLLLQAHLHRADRADAVVHQQLPLRIPDRSLRQHVY